MCSPSDRSGINDKKTKNNTTNGWPAFIGRKQVQQQYKKNRQYKQKQHSHFWDLPRTPNNKFESQKKVRVIFASPSDYFFEIFWKFPICFLSFLLLLGGRKASCSTSKGQRVCMVCMVCWCFCLNNVESREESYCSMLLFDGL